MIQKLKWWLPSIALMCFIFYMSSRQNISVTQEFNKDFIIFKTLHVLEYALLTFLNFVALRKTTKHPRKSTIILAIVFAFAYGVLDEIHQTFVPSRSGVPRDVFIDLVGMGLVGYVLQRNKALDF